MPPIPPFNEYPEVEEVLQSKQLRTHIRNELRKFRLYSYTEDDILNQVCLYLVEALQSGKNISYPVAWSRKVSQRHIWRLRNKSKSQPTDPDRLEYLSNQHANLNLPYDEKAEIIEKLQKLKLEQRKLLEWYFFDGLSWPEIAELLSQQETKEINAVTARKRGQRAKEELRRIYLENY